MQNKPELLAPVGGRKQLEAAVNNGADAVYMGGTLFNARIKADNFGRADLADAIDYAHERGVKVYITLNTLIKDSELAQAFEYANFLYGAGADAVILQDLGLARLVHKYLPDFPMHLSTQGTVYNEWAIPSLRRLGFCRVVPARELTLTELQNLVTECHHGDGSSGNFVPTRTVPGGNKVPAGTVPLGTSVEVEVFVHGALCMCYSGQCHMSRVLGRTKGEDGKLRDGRSGNRGVCAQPCRLPYTDENGQTTYALSPKDLCLINDIPELIEAGVDSFKIEGRLKSPEYVAVVTGIYRKYIDRYMHFRRDNDAETARELYHVDAEDMQNLTQIFNRGGFTKGYLFGNPGDEILSGSSPKNNGVYVGRISRITKEIRGKDKVLVEVSAAAEINPGDGVEIRSKTSGPNSIETNTGNIVTYLKKLPNGNLEIGDFDRTVSAGDRVYKVTDKPLNEKALNAPEKRVPVCMRFSARIGDVPKLEMRLKNMQESEAKSVAVSGEKPAEKALKKPTDSLRIREQLCKLGDTSFEVLDFDEIEVEIEEGIMIPVSEINRMRRDGAEALLEAIKGAKPTVLSDEEIATVVAEEKLGDESAIKEVQKKSARNMPHILNVSKGKLDAYIMENFESVCNDAKDTGIAVGNLGWIERFREAGLKVYGDHGLNVYNEQAVKALEELGVEVVELSAEADRTRQGGTPLMITEHPVKAKVLTDRKGVTHKVTVSESGDKYLIW